MNVLERGLEMFEIYNFSSYLNIWHAEFVIHRYYNFICLNVHEQLKSSDILYMLCCDESRWPCNDAKEIKMTFCSVLVCNIDVGVGMVVK